MVAIMPVAISRDSIHREYACLHQGSLASLAHLQSDEPVQNTCVSDGEAGQVGKPKLLATLREKLCAAGGVGQAACAERSAERSEAHF